MAFTGPNYKRLSSDKNVTIALAPTGAATGLSNVFEPEQSELAYGGAGAFLNASPAVSWNDFDFGIQESDRESDPSLADDSTFEDFGQQNYGGGISFFYPKFYDDASSDLSNVYDVTEHEWTLVDVVQRIDGEKPNNTAIEDGDFVHAMRTITDGEDNTLEGSDALRRTVQFLSQGEVAVYTVVGDHDLTPVEPANAWAEGNKARLRVTIQGRDVTNMDTISFLSDDPDVVRITAGGFYEVTGSPSDTATITIVDEGAGTSETVSVTVT